MPALIQKCLEEKEQEAVRQKAEEELLANPVETGDSKGAADDANGDPTEGDEDDDDDDEVVEHVPDNNVNKGKGKAKSKKGKGKGKRGSGKASLRLSNPIGGVGAIAADDASVAGSARTG
eukprot:5746516-Amphidinium_carterae.1